LSLASQVFTPRFESCIAKTLPICGPKAAAIVNAAAIDITTNFRSGFIIPKSPSYTFADINTVLLSD
jgi:hypothetical protein